MIEGQRSPEEHSLIRGVLDEVYIRYSKDATGKVNRIWPFNRYPLKKCLSVFYYTYERLSGNNFLINEHWDETTAALARILLSERTQAQLADVYTPEAPKVPLGQNRNTNRF